MERFKSQKLGESWYLSSASSISKKPVKSISFKKPTNSLVLNLNNLLFLLLDNFVISSKDIASVRVHASADVLPHAAP